MIKGSAIQILTAPDYMVFTNSEDTFIDNVTESHLRYLMLHRKP